MPSMPEPMVGDVWEVLFGSGVGREQQGIRSALVISNQDYNGIPHGLCIVVPITGTRRGVASQLDVAPPEGGFTKPSVILCEQVRALSLLRFRRKRGEVSQDMLAQVQAVVGAFIFRV